MAITITPDMLRARRAEIEAALAALPATQLREREDLEVALTAIDELLGKDLGHPTKAVEAEAERWLANTRRYLDELRVLRP